MQQRNVSRLAIAGTTLALGACTGRIAVDVPEPEPLPMAPRGNAATTGPGSPASTAAPAPTTTPTQPSTPPSPPSSPPSSAPPQDGTTTPGGGACFDSSLPPEVQPILPTHSVADACAAAAQTTAWTAPDGGVMSSSDARANLVGRWVPCGAPGFGTLPHAGVEFGANGRWRLLDADASGALVPTASTAPQAEGRYYALGSGQLDVHDDAFVFGEIFFVAFASAWDAVEFKPDGSAPSFYARTAPSPENGRDNAPSVSDGACTMVGTWDLTGDQSSSDSPSASFAFDEAGNFVGGPLGSDLCASHTMYGTYRYSSGLFQITENVGMGLCAWWFDAGYPATIDASCSKLTLTQQYDNCTGGRGYFNGHTTLTRRR